MNKIVFYIGSMQMGGAERVMNNLVNYFIDQHVEVCLINDIIPASDALEYEINPLAKRYFLDEKKYDGLKKNFKRIIKLRKILKKEEPEIVLAFLGQPNIRMLVASLGLNTKKVVSVRNDPYKEYGGGIIKIITGLIFHLADGCIFQTKDAAKYYPQKVQNKSAILFNPVNEKFYKCQWNGEGKDIVVIGRLQAQKNPLLALEAFIKIESYFPDYRIVFYGEEELAEPIRRKSLQLGLSDRVIVYGKTSEIEKKLEYSCLYVLSSDYEGMPNALMEAMAVGVPVISTDCPCGGPRTLIENEHQGILVPCGDVEGLSNAMRQIISDKQRQIKMSNAEKRRAKEFLPEVIYKQWDIYLNSIL